MSSPETLPADEARAVYTTQWGWGLLPTYAPAHRPRTPDEDRQLLEALQKDPHDEKLIALRATTFVADPNVPQPRLHMGHDNGPYVAIRCPVQFSAAVGWDGLPIRRNGSEDTSAALAAIQANLVRTLAIASHDGASIVYVFRAPPGVQIKHHWLKVDGSTPGYEGLAAASDDPDHGGVRLPAAGARERFVGSGKGADAVGGIVPLPEEWLGVVRGEGDVDDAALAAWIDANYESAPKGQGTTRGEVYATFLSANNLVPTQLPEPRFGTAARGAKCFSSTKTAKGIRWHIQRKGTPLVPLAGVSAATINPVELAAFYAWRAALESSPARREQRAAHAAAIVAAAKAQAKLEQTFGDEATRDAVLTSGFLATVAGFERTRQLKCLEDQERFIACHFSGDLTDQPGVLRVTPSMWKATEGITRHRDRYDALVALAQAAHAAGGAK